MANVDLRMDPEQLQERGNDIIAEVNRLDECVNLFLNATKKLSGWHGLAKDKLDAKLNDTFLKELREAIEIARSYGDAPRAIGAMAVESENSNLRAIG